MGFSAPALSSQLKEVSLNPLRYLPRGLEPTWHFFPHQIHFPSLILAFNDFFPYFHFSFLDYRKVFVSTKPDLALLGNIFLTDSCLLVLMFILVSHSKHEVSISKGSLTPALPPTSWTFFVLFLLLYCFVLLCYVFNFFCIILPKFQVDPLSCQDLL